MLREDVITAASWHWRRWLKREQLLLQTRDILLLFVCVVLKIIMLVGMGEVTAFAN